MKIAVISDTHLGSKYDKSLFRYLQNIIENHDKILILGDFWESYQITLEQFIKSPWNKLFKMLKNKKAIYIWGNHDYKINDRLVYNFCNMYCESYTLKWKGQVLNFEHGHKYYSETKDQKYKIRLLPTFITKNLLKINGFEQHNRNEANDYIESLSQNKPLRDADKNNRMKYGRKEPDVWLITGHTHRPEIDYVHKYINTGFISYGFGSYLQITNNKLNLIVEKY